MPCTRTVPVPAPDASDGADLPRDGTDNGAFDTTDFDMTVFALDGSSAAEEQEAAAAEVATAAHVGVGDSARSNGPDSGLRRLDTILSHEARTWTDAHAWTVSFVEPLINGTGIARSETNPRTLGGVVTLLHHHRPHRHWP